MTETKKTATKTAAKTTKKAAPAKTTAKKAVADVKLANATYATGKRKDSVARVYMIAGKGQIFINDIPVNEYFRRPVLQMIIAQPFGITKRDSAYDIHAFVAGGGLSGQAFVAGGGLSGQAGAVKHGISKALEKAEPDLRKTLKAAGFLTRDSRVVERKHFGRHKARRSTQFSKR